MDTSDKIALAALIIAFGSLVFSLLSHRISVKAYRLAEKDHTEKTLGIRPYLIDGFTFSVKNKKFCGFALSITNLSSSSKSFSNIELQLEYVLQSGECGKAISQRVADVDPPNIKSEYQKLSIPLNIPPKESVSGWITFLKPDVEGVDLNVKEYKIVGICNEESVEIATAYLLRFITDEKDKN